MAEIKNKNIFQSIKCAVRGMAACCREERNFREYAVIAVIFLIFNILLSVRLWEYIVYIILVSAVYSTEFINTAIERIIDKYSGEINETNKFIKDVASAGVLTFAIAFFTAEGLILIPKLAERCFQ